MFIGTIVLIVGLSPILLIPLIGMLRLIGSIVIYLIRIPRYSHIVRRHPSFPPPFLLFTSNNGDFERLCEKEYSKEKNQYEDIVHQGYYIGGSHLLGVNSAEAFRDILSDPDGNFPKEVAYDSLETLLGKGLVTATGSAWKTQRRVLTPSFHFGFLKILLTLIKDSTRDLLIKLESSGGAEINPVDEASVAALKIVVESSVGDSLDPALMTNLFKEMLSGFEYYFASYAFLGPFLTSWLPFDFAQNLPRKRKVLEELVTDAIEKKREAWKKHPSLKETQRDFLSAMLSSDELSNQDIIDNAITFFFAGHDTTSSTLSWCIFFLAKYPEFQEEIKQELDENDFGLETLTIEKLESFKSLKNFIHEVLRHRPTANIGREAMQDCTLAGQFIPKGSVLVMNVYNVHRDPRYWDDPEAFKPSRFANGNEEGSARHPYAYLPFSGGPRTCIGRRFAMIEVMTILAAVVQKFTIEGKTDGVVIDVRFLSKPNDFKARFIPRS